MFDESNKCIIIDSSPVAFFFIRIASLGDFEPNSNICFKRLIMPTYPALPFITSSPPLASGAASTSVSNANPLHSLVASLSVAPLLSHRGSHQPNHLFNHLEYQLVNPLCSLLQFLLPSHLSFQALFQHLYPRVNLRDNHQDSLLHNPQDCHLVSQLHSLRVDLRLNLR